MGSGLAAARRPGMTVFFWTLPATEGYASAGSATFALGKAFCYYYRAVHQGHVPKAEDLKRYYHDQLAQAAKLWSTS